MSTVLADRYYTQTHEWVKVDGDVATIGITDYAQHEMGDIVYVELPTNGDAIEAGERFTSIEAVKAVEDTFCPVTGEIIEANENLDDEPDLINKAPYEDGWIIKVKLANKEEIKNLLTAEAYENMLAE